MTAMTHLDPIPGEGALVARSAPAIAALMDRLPQNAARAVRVRYSANCVTISAPTLTTGRPLATDADGHPTAPPGHPDHTLTQIILAACEEFDRIGWGYSAPLDLNMRQTHVSARPPEHGTMAGRPTLRPAEGGRG